MSLEWILDESKFLTPKEVKKLERTMNKGRKSKNKNRVKDSFIIYLALYTGLRVQEIADLKICDLYLEANQSSLLVRKGKCGRQRIVYFGNKLKEYILEYLEFKKQTKEPLNEDSPLIYSKFSKDHVHKRTIQETFKRFINLADIPKKHSVHHLRHTYAINLYRSSNSNLRLVQKQLGHSKISTTTVYANVFNINIDKAIQKVYK